MGAFYWLWHHGGSRERDTTVLLKEHPNEFMGAGWETFRFVINRHPISESKTSLEVYNNGFYETKEYIDYNISGNVMNVYIPIAALSIKNDVFKVRFKCSDSIEKESDILDYYVSGCSVPIGRLSYTYILHIENV